MEPSIYTQAKNKTIIHKSSTETAKPINESTGPGKKTNPNTSTEKGSGGKGKNSK
ncbi:hypothetical protein SCD90_09645 [Terrihabitans sp. PJ23]|uniref:Uncharacterized protein n=1 Tax=Terrihabitans rhizophilus TaxID=3092662 RepID=A0ABU4RNA9_9HYPH|nr:hypothetical protein [Terrihabitans sp. PJ23]